jgi:hypothetical protein
MVTFLDDYNCPPVLEDEVFMIETSGEMPEVALAESLSALGDVSPEELRCLWLAVARSYVRMLRRDFNPANQGLSEYRGLDRAAANYQRLVAFLAKVDARLSPATWDGLAGNLARYLAAEQDALAQGRAYVTCSTDVLQELGDNLGLDLTPWADVLARTADLPVVDALGLRALRVLQGPAGRLRTRPRGGMMLLEIVDDAGEVKAGMALPWAGPDGREYPAHRARIDLVCRLLGRET